MSVTSRPESKWRYSHSCIGNSRILHVIVADRRKLERTAVDYPLMESRLHQVWW